MVNPRPSPISRLADDSSGSPPERTSSRLEEDAEQPQPLRALQMRPVLTSVANYTSLALLDIAAGALMPLVWSTPIALGGLGLAPASIDLWLSAYGCASALVQIAFFPRFVARFGPGRVVVTGAAAFAAIYVLFPFEDVLARAAVVWPLIALQLMSHSVSDMWFGAVFVFISLNQLKQWVD